MLRFFLCFLKLKGIFIRTGKKWDKDAAVAEEDALNFAYVHINAEPQKYDADDNYTLEYALAHYGETINERWRNEQPNKDDRDMAAMIAANSADCDLVLYRGISKNGFLQMVEDAKREQYKKKYILEKAFMSCSLVKGHELNHEVKLRIYVPKGTHLLYLGNVNDEQEFYEVVVQYGALLKVVSADKKYVNCELMGTR